MNENGGKSSTILLTVIGIATLLVVVVGATFAYFAAQVSGNDSVSSLSAQAASNGTRTETFESEPVVLSENIYPRTEAWVTVPVKLTLGGNTTEVQGSRTYIFTLTSTNDFEKTNIKQLDGNIVEVDLPKYIKYEVTDLVGITAANVKVAGKQQLPNTDTEIVRITVNNNEAKEIQFNVKLYFEEDKDLNQNDNKKHTASLYVTYTSVD